ncbi:MAG: peptidylglycine alpha-amidating monooxygenase [Minicystis sp.]
MKKAIAWFLSAAAVLSACGGGVAENTGGAGGTGGTQGKLPCNVDAVLAAGSCRTCHGATPSYGAPMPLVTYADLQAKAVTDPNRKVYELVKERVHDDARPMPQAPYPRLTGDQLAVLDTWVAVGAPSGTQACEGTGGSGGGGAPPVQTSCTPDIHLQPAQAWTMPADQHDVYVCYGVDVPAGDKKNVTAFVPRIDNTKIVHHVLLYQSDTPVSPTPETCGGTVTVGQGKQLVYGWAPGGKPFELPADVGIPMDATTHYYVQVHYNNIQGLVGEQDTSGFDLCSTTEDRPNAAGMVAFGTLKIDLPPAAETAADCSYTWPAAAGDVHAIAAFPHMHKLGTSIWTKLDPGGAAVDLGTNAPWDFNNQPFIPIDAAIHPGDTIETRCAWKNNTPNEVKFGENTEDEMCFSFTMYYPRAASFKSWLVPSAFSQCK